MCLLIVLQNEVSVLGNPQELCLCDLYLINGLFKEVVKCATSPIKLCKA